MLLKYASTVPGSPQRPAKAFLTCFYAARKRETRQSENNDRRKSMDKKLTSTLSWSSNTRSPCLGVYMNLQGVFTLVFRQPGKKKRGNQKIVIREKEWTKYELPPRHAPQIRVHRPWESLETCKSFSHLSLHSYEKR